MFSACVVYIPFQKQTPGGYNDSFGGKVRSLKSFPSEQLRTTKEESSSDHTEDQKKNYSQELGTYTNSQKDWWEDQEEEFDEGNFVEARKGFKKLARIQKVIKG